MPDPAAGTNIGLNLRTTVTGNTLDVLVIAPTTMQALPAVQPSPVMLSWSVSEYYGLWTDCSGWVR